MRGWRRYLPALFKEDVRISFEEQRIERQKDQEFLMGHILPEGQNTYYDKTKVENLRRSTLR